MKDERDERRKKGDVLLMDYGHLLERNPNHGLPVNCYVCGAAHTASGVARIQHNRSTTHVPLCEPCLASNDQANAVVRKFWNAPDLEFSEGGEMTTEQLIALANNRIRRSIRRKHDGL